MFLNNNHQKSLRTAFIIQKDLETTYLKYSFVLAMLLIPYKYFIEYSTFILVNRLENQKKKLIKQKQTLTFKQIRWKLAD